jgi:hypothetical protein
VVSFAGRTAGRLALACLVLLGSAAAAAGAPPSVSSSFFHMSPINVAASPGASALRFSVSLAHVAPSEQPAFRWDLTLARSGLAAAACTNSKLPGGQKVKGNEIAWTNQGASFVWYGGGVAACRGTVAVVAENEYQQCSASLSVPLPDSSSGSGAPAACKLGGFTFGAASLPVPAALLASSATTTATLARLRGELQRRALTARAFERLVTPILRQQDSSFSRLFPEVFGCGFARLFEPVLLAKSGLDEQLATGTVSTVAVASDAGYLQAAARTASDCRRTASNPAGASAAVRSGLARLAAEANGLLGSRPPAARRLAALSAHLKATLRRGFPPLFGISYGALLSRLAAADSAIALAEQSTRAGKDGSAAGELAGALGPVGAIHQGLVRHQQHVIKLENANG